MNKILTMIMMVMLSFSIQSQTVDLVFNSNGFVQFDSTQLANVISQAPQLNDGTYGDVEISNGVSVFTIGSNSINGANVIDGSIGASDLDFSGVSAGTYTNANVTVNSKGQVTEIHNGFAGSTTTTIVTSGYKGAYNSIIEANGNAVDNTEGDYVIITSGSGFEFTEGDLMTVYNNPAIHGTQLSGAFNNKPMYSTKAIGLASTGAFEFFIEYLEAGDQFNAWQNDGASGLFHFHGVIETEFDSSVDNELAVPQSGVSDGSFNTATFYNGTYRFNTN